MPCADPEGGTPSPEKKNIEFLSNTCPDPLKNYKAAMPVFNLGPSSARQQNVILNAIKMAFSWQSVDGPLILGI